MRKQVFITLLATAGLGLAGAVIAGSPAVSFNEASLAWSEAMRASDTDLSSEQGYIPGHLGSILTPDEQRLLIAAWAENDEDAARFILDGGMRGAPAQLSH